MTIDDLNGGSHAGLMAVLGTIYEHSPWIAEAALAQRPFASIDDLQQTMAQAVAEAGADRQLALVRAHPDLAGRLARAGELEPASAGEQADLGLDRLSDAEFEKFATLNRAYVERFGFPFVIAVRRHTRESVMEAFGRRLNNSHGAELATALAEIDAIAGFRLHDLFGANSRWT